MKKLEIEFRDNGTGHKDIFLNISELKQTQVADSYYLILDSKEETIKGAKKVLIKLLTYWIDIVSNLEQNQVKNLPFDFSDQYLGGFQVSLTDDSRIALKYGFTLEIMGYSISPSQPAKVNSIPIIFKEDNRELDFFMNRADLIDDITLSIENIKAKIL